MFVSKNVVWLLCKTIDQAIDDTNKIKGHFSFRTFFGSVFERFFLLVTFYIEITFDQVVERKLRKVFKKWVHNEKTKKPILLCLIKRTLKSCELSSVFHSRSMYCISIHFRVMIQNVESKFKKNTFWRDSFPNLYYIKLKYKRVFFTCLEKAESVLFSMLFRQDSRRSAEFLARLARVPLAAFGTPHPAAIYLSTGR